MKCKHNNWPKKCILCFDEKFPIDPKTGKRQGFVTTGEKTGGKW